MQSKQRYVVVFVLAMAALVGITLSHSFEWVFVQMAVDDPYLFSLRQLPMSAALGYALAAGGAIFALKHKPTYQLELEVVDELSKVTWPSREETGNATVVVIVTVLISSVYLGAFDAVWLWLTDLILQVPPDPAG